MDTEKENIGGGHQLRPTTALVAAAAAAAAAVAASAAGFTAATRFGKWKLSGSSL